MNGYLCTQVKTPEQLLLKRRRLWESESYLIDLYRVADKQGVLFLLVFLAVFIHEVSETQTDTQHHTWRRRTHKLWSTIMSFSIVSCDRKAVVKYHQEHKRQILTFFQFVLVFSVQNQGAFSELNPHCKATKNNKEMKI